jgi:hypothetical protein
VPDGKALRIPDDLRGCDATWSTDMMQRIQPGAEPYANGIRPRRNLHGGQIGWTSSSLKATTLWHKPASAAKIAAVIGGWRRTGHGAHDWYITDRNEYTARLMRPAPSRCWAKLPGDDLRRSQDWWKRAHR